MTTKEQLQLEIAQVEKILELAKDSSTLDEADDLSMHFIKTGKTHTFNSIDINEYLAYIYDKRIDERKGDFEAAKGPAENISYPLEEIRMELKEARQKLATLE